MEKLTLRHYGIILLILIVGIGIASYIAYNKGKNDSIRLQQTEAAIKSNKAKLDTNSTQADAVTVKAKKASKSLVKRAELVIEESTYYEPTGSDSVAGKYLIGY